MAEIELLRGETVLIDTLGDIGKRVGFAKGRVVLTDQRLLLRPDALNIDRSPSDVALADIASVETFNILGLLALGYCVEMPRWARAKAACYGSGPPCSCTPAGRWALVA